MTTLAERVLSKRRVTRWRLEVLQPSGRWTLAAYFPAIAQDESPQHACWRLRQTAPIYANRQIRALPV